jgi:hypothetical protein
MEELMKVTLESTSKIVELTTPEGYVIPSRVWEGKSERGIERHAYILRIAVHEDLDRSQFEAELKECRTPSAAIAALPGRLIV